MGKRPRCTLFHATCMSMLIVIVIFTGSCWGQGGLFGSGGIGAGSGSFSSVSGGTGAYAQYGADYGGGLDFSGLGRLYGRDASTSAAYRGAAGLSFRRRRGVRWARIGGELAAFDSDEHSRWSHHLFTRREERARSRGNGQNSEFRSRDQSPVMLKRRRLRIRTSMEHRRRMGEPLPMRTHARRIPVDSDDDAGAGNNNMWE